MRGDLLRWRGEWELARVAYRRALELKRGDAVLLAALAQVDREERASLAPVWDDLGTTGTFTYVEDNAGYLYLAAGGRHAVRTATLASVGSNRAASRSSFAERLRLLVGRRLGLSRSWRMYAGGRVGAGGHRSAHYARG